MCACRDRQGGAGLVYACACGRDGAVKLTTRGRRETLSSLVPRPHPLLGKRGLVNLDSFLGLAGSVRARRHRCTETNLGSDWSVRARADDSNLYSRQWRFAFLRLASHMTVLKLQSHRSAQIPFPGPRIVSKFTRPFFLAEGGVWARD